MIPYLVCAVTVSALAYLSNASKKAFGKFPAYVCIVAIVAILTLMSGFRGLDVGTDVTVYGLSTYRSALHLDFETFVFNAGFSDSIGLFCLIYMWVAARLFQSFSGYLAALALITVVPVVIASFKEGREYAPLVLFVFCLVFYPASFNMMRQYVAMGFILLAFLCAQSKNLPGYLAYSGVAIFFHGSAFVALPIYWVVQYGSRVKFRGTLLLVMCVLVVFAFLPQMFEALGSVVGRYSEYLTGEHSLVSGGRRQRLVLSLCCLVCFLFYCVLKKNESASNVRFLALLCLLGILGFCLSSFSFYLYRVGFYYLYFLPLLAASATRRVEGCTEKIFFVCVVALISVAFFYDYYYITGANEVIPYDFDIKVGV